jgi:prepilin-type processing-associated H-X9-DG protein/prepilin-type N-terminal cleavage/methylation domain-containing protein
MKGSGFTLMELIVVIAVIALLLAVLLPALHSSREHANAVRCGLNVDQLLLGLFNYGMEHGSFPCSFDNTPLEPPPGGYAGHFAYDKAGWWWFDYAFDYSTTNRRKKSMLWCPSRTLTDRRFESCVLYGNYGVNMSVCRSSDDIFGRGDEFAGIPLGVSDIRRPGQTLLVTDSGYTKISWWHVTDAPPVPLSNMAEDTAYIPGLETNAERELFPGQKIDAIQGRHPNKTVNVGFADGHVDRVRASQLFVEKIGEGHGNRSPLWRPE